MYEGFDLTRYVPVMSVTLLAFTCFFALMVPIVAIILFRKKFHCSFSALFYGAADYLSVEFMLCQISWLLLLLIPVFQTASLAYVIVGLIVAALIFEGGRYLLMRMLVRQNVSFGSVFLFATGVFAVNSFMNVLTTSFETFVIAITINDTGLETLAAEAGENAMDMLRTIEPLLDSHPFIYLMPGLDLFVNLLFHISASVLVYAVCRGKVQKHYLPVVMGLRFIYELPGYLYSYGLIITNPYVAEVISVIVTAAIAYMAYHITKIEMPDELTSLKGEDEKQSPFPKFNANVKKGSITKNANILSNKKEN